jgi:hypothetical protein
LWSLDSYEFLSKPRRDWTRGGIRDTIYVSEEIIMKVTFSNKYVPFEEIVITSKESNTWEYRPSVDRSGRLTAKFDWNYEDPMNALLSVKTVFNHVIDEQGNLVMKPVKNKTFHDVFV